MTNYDKWDKEFRTQNLFAFNDNQNALLWLKTRAICRGKLLMPFLSENSIVLNSSKIAEQNIELFCLLENMPNSMEILDKYLRVKSHNWYDSIGIDETKLKDDLYKLQSYTWGGDQNNSLDKFLVSKYVKSISSFDDLLQKKAEIASNAWSYVQTSWYNNWTSYLIESLFKRHPKVVSAIGEIKSVDFFIGSRPIDLKVTFFPNQFMDEKIKERLGQKELSWLKKQAKIHNINYDGTLEDSQLTYILKEKLNDNGYESITNEMNCLRREIVFQTKDHPIEIMQWLYENQGEMRFGAENRIFVILVDTSDMTQSWKMKRAFSIIEPNVKMYLDSFSDGSLQLINFSFKKQSYRSY